MIPASSLFDQSVLSAQITHDPLVQDYRTFFALLDWSAGDLWERERSARGRPPHPESTYLKAFLLRIREGMIYTTQLRRFLLRHPFLIIELGFHLVLDPTAPYGFDIEQTVPCEYWLREKLRRFDQTVLQTLLAGTVKALQEEIPGLGETVAFDVKHLYAWVKENNERVYVPDRYDKTQRLAGDPDCRLGVKRSTNQEQPDGSTKAKKELLWGYGTGVAVSTIAEYGTVVLAEYTQPFNETDITYFRPLYHQAALALNQFPTNLAADAAYDAWYVYEAAARHGGIAAVPLNQHSKTPFARQADGTPLCPIGLPMHPTKQFNHTYGYRAQRFQCPLLFPEKTGQTCTHEQFVKGKGCVKDVNWELGGIQRVTLDRKSFLSHALYRQRTGCERVNARAKELGIERPRVRNGRSVAHLNTLIYVIVNLRVLIKAQSINKGLLQMN
ncbi:MAG: transposase [Ktedonobacteraceae bacterium]